MGILPTAFKGGVECREWFKPKYEVSSDKKVTKVGRV
jgi:hypothetical protein